MVGMSYRIDNSNVGIKNSNT